MVSEHHNRDGLPPRLRKLCSLKLIVFAARSVESPPESEDEKAALAQLLDACLSGDSGLHGTCSWRTQVEVHTGAWSASMFETVCAHALLLSGHIRGHSRLPPNSH
jgi:hypothetical protein